MRALTVTRPTEVALVERPDPVPAASDVMLRPRMIGICGTDLDIIDGSVDPKFIRYPIVLGHEWVGEVVAIGGPMTSPALGQLAVVEGIVPCGVCAECVAGRTNHCRTYDEFGFTRDGAARDLVTAPARLVHALRPNVSVESAALVEPASVVYRGLQRACPRPDQRVLVIGDGTIALLAARLVRLWSPRGVIMLGQRPAQRELAAAAGADDFRVTPLDADDRFDLVIDAAGSPDAVMTALRAPCRGGTVVLLGYAGADRPVPFPVDDVINADLTITASFGYTSAVWREVVDLLNGGRLDLGFLVTHRFALDDWPVAIDTLRGQAAAGPRAKVALVP